MNEKEQARIFQEECDALLGIFSSSPNQPAASSSDSGLLETASLLARTDFSPESGRRSLLRSQLMSRAANSRRDTMSKVTNRRSFRPAWAALAAAALIIALLVIYRQPVLAAVGRWFGYVYSPLAGFIRTSDSRLLSAPVTQEHAGTQLTVTLGVQTAKKTELWVEFSGSSESLDGAWLSFGDNQRLDAIEWRWLYENNRPVGGRILFPPIPQDVSQTTLALPQGWRLPLEWIPAAEAGLQPTEISSPQPTENPGSQTPNPLSEMPPPSLPICTSNNNAAVCLQAASVDEHGLHFLIEAELLEKDLLFETDIVDPSPLGVPSETRLTDDLGGSYPMQPLEPPLDEFYQSRQRQTLSFPSPTKGASILHLRIAALAAITRQAGQLQLNLGDNPQPGQVLEGPWKIELAGQEIVFTRAEIASSASGGLVLNLFGQPQDPTNGRLVTMLDLNRPEGVEGSYGGGFDPSTRQLNLNFELVNPATGTKKSGLLTLDITGARFSLLGPFEFSLPTPTPQILTSPTPLIASSDTYQPGPTPTPLAMDDFALSSRPLVPGDLLIATWDGSNTVIYVAPEGKQPPERYAILPGNLVAYQLAPNRSRLDYLTAAPDENGIYQDVRLFSLSLDGSSLPNQVGGPWAYLQNPAWSYDSRFLYYETFVNRIGEGRQGWILDLACLSDQASCQAAPVIFPSGVYVFSPLWSPTRYQMAFGGAYEGALADVFTLTLDESYQPGELFNLSASPASDDQTKAWLPDGSGLLVHCAQNPSEPNQANLCKADLSTLEETVLTRLPEGFFDFTLSPDANQIIGAHLVGRGNDRLELRSFNLSDGSLQPLARAAQFFSYRYSADGGKLAIVQRVDDTVSAAVIDLKTGQQTRLIEHPLNQAEMGYELRLFNIAWVK